MVNKRKIQEFAGQVAAQFRPDRIILFGSYAYGSPTEDSDVDLLVVMPDGGDPLGTAAKIRRQIPRSFPLDLIVRDPEDLTWRIRQHDWFLKEAVEKGIVIHEADHS